MIKKSKHANILASWKIAFALVALMVIATGNIPAAGNAGVSQEPDISLFNLNNLKNNLIHRVYAPSGLLHTGEGVSLWHDYGEFALYRISDAALNRLSAADRARLTLAGEASLVIAGREFKVQEIGSNPLFDTHAVVSGPALQLVQFVGPVKEEWLAAIESIGATPIHYIATNGYLLWADSAARDELDKMVQTGEFLELSTPYPDGLKIGPAIEKRQDPDEVVEVVIQMYRHSGSGESETTIQDLAENLLSGWMPILEFQNLYAEIRVGDLAKFISLPDVFWIEERMERELTDEVQDQIMAGSFNADQSGPSAPGYLPWLSSLGFSTDPAEYPVLDITDDGIGNGTVNSGDPTLHQFGDIANPTRLAYIGNCTNSATGEGRDGHGHINTSIAGGYDQRAGFPFVDPLGFLRGLGINPFGRLAGTRIFDPTFDQSSCGGTDTGVIKSIQDHGAAISSNS